jgi:trimethylamine--corrinoid protein Co-methyltransferase
MAQFADKFRIRKPVDTMSENDKRMIHEAALEAMEKVGIRVHSENARAVLKRAGAIVDDRGPDVRFPHDLVGFLVSKAPSSFVLAGRSKELLHD